MHTRFAKSDPDLLVSDWNTRHQVGTDVTVTLDDGAKVKTKTRSYAWVLSGHSAVVMLEGFNGCYRLDRVAAS